MIKTKVKVSNISCILNYNLLLLHNKKMKNLEYNDSYFNYLFILMRYASFVTRRRIKVKEFIFLEYAPTGLRKDGDIRIIIINDRKRKALILFIYTLDKETDKFKPLGEARIYGYYPKQVRKILYNLQNKIRDDREYRQKFYEGIVTISRNRNYYYKKRMGFL